MVSHIQNLFGVGNPTFFEEGQAHVTGYSETGYEEEEELVFPEPKGNVC